MTTGQEVGPETRLLDARIDARLALLGEKSSIEGGGGGPYDPGMNARVAKLEASVEYIRSDISEIKTDLRSTRDRITSSKDDLLQRITFSKDDLLKKIDEVAKEARADFKWLLLGGLAALVALAGMMAHGFHWI